MIIIDIHNNNYNRYTCTSVIATSKSKTMDFGKERGFLLDREDLPEKVGLTKESYFLEFI